MKKELKHTISETVSRLRKLFVKLKNISDSKSRAISELETSVTKLRTQYANGGERYNNVHVAPSLIPSQEPGGRTAQGTSPPADRREKLYSPALWNKVKQKKTNCKIEIKQSRGY
jgi:hypothetical protein